MQLEGRASFEICLRMPSGTHNPCQLRLTTIFVMCSAVPGNVPGNFVVVLDVIFLEFGNLGGDRRAGAQEHTCPEYRQGIGEASSWLVVIRLAR